MVERLFKVMLSAPNRKEVTLPWLEEEAESQPQPETQEQSEAEIEDWKKLARLNNSLKLNPIPMNSSLRKLPR